MIILINITGTELLIESSYPKIRIVQTENNCQQECIYRTLTKQ